MITTILIIIHGNYYVSVYYDNDHDDDSDDNNMMMAMMAMITMKFLMLFKRMMMMAMIMVKILNLNMMMAPLMIFNLYPGPCPERDAGRRCSSGYQRRHDDRTLWRSDYRRAGWRPVGGWLQVYYGKTTGQALYTTIYMASCRWLVTSTLW